MPYLNVDEVESAIELVAQSNPGVTALIDLPHRTWEGRTSRAIRVHTGPAAVDSIYLLGGVHAREWGSSDILVHFVQRLTEAHRTGTGITLGGKSFSASDIRGIVEKVEIVVFPQANPDGRRHSMSVDPMWRKNRRPAANSSPACAVGGGSGPGVDLNRNYEFLWDYPKTFSPDAPVMTSTDPCSEIFRGPNPSSEPETQNVTWLLDQHPAVGYFIDIHSFGEDILYNWGDDDNQTTDPAMNFRNSTYDGARGIPDSTPGGDPKKYREYLPNSDLTELIALGTTMADAIRATHGRRYSVKGAAGLYPTSGTSDDNAYSRSFIDSARKRVLGYTIEWGPERTSIPQSFHPNYPDMVPIIEEVTAALVAFCAAVAARVGD